METKEETKREPLFSTERQTLTMIWCELSFIAMQRCLKADGKFAYMRQFQRQTFKVRAGKRFPEPISNCDSLMLEMKELIQRSVDRDFSEQRTDKGCPQIANQILTELRLNEVTVSIGDVGAT